MKIAASTAVARDSAVVAPRAPNTVPEAPAPKPAPASAPLPRCSRTRPMMARAENSCTIVRIQRNIGNTRSSRSGSGQDAQKLIRLQRRATDQTAVDVRHGEELRRVTGLDAASVEDAGGGRNSSIPGADAGADEGVHFLRLVGRRVAAGADRPHRLVGDHALLEPARPAKLEHHIELPRDHLARAPRVAIGELLADAQDRHEPPGVRGAELARDQLIARKFGAAHARGLVPILCVGEQLADRDAGRTREVVARQLDVVLELCGAGGLEQGVVAYEPVWAIGTGRNATPDQAQEVHAFIRARIGARDARIAAATRILYGGSVKAGNAAELFAMPDVDGGLIGGASLKADEFLTILAAAGPG